MNQNDHDLLIRVDTNLQNLTLEVKSLRDNTLSRIASVEAIKLDKIVFESHKEETDKAVKSLQERQEDLQKKQDKQSTYIYIGIGIIITLQFVATLVR